MSALSTAIEVTRTVFDQGIERVEREDEPEMSEYAALADAAYMPPKQREKTVATHAKGYTLDPDVSDRWVSVFTRGDDVVTSVRGTKLDEFADLESDAYVATGHTKMSTRYRHANKKFADVLAKYPSEDYNHVLAGHSLGGSINLHLNEEYRDHIMEVHNFNPGSGLGSAMSGLQSVFHRNDTKDAHVTNYFVDGDVISSLGRGHHSHRNVVLKPRKGSTNPHTIAQFYKKKQAKAKVVKFKFT